MEAAVKNCSVVKPNTSPLPLVHVSSTGSGVAGSFVFWTGADLDEPT